MSSILLKEQAGGWKGCYSVPHVTDFISFRNLRRSFQVRNFFRPFCFLLRFLCSRKSRTASRPQQRDVQKVRGLPRDFFVEMKYGAAQSELAQT